MEYVFHERKAGQAAAYLLRRLGGESSPIVLNQLLYLADRRAMCSDGFPITGDRLMASPVGMILGRVYELNLPRQWPPAEAWREYVSAPDECGLIQPAGATDTLDLSQWEELILDAICDEFGGLTGFDLAARLQKLPEYHVPEGRPELVDPKVVLRSAEFTDEGIEGVIDQLERGLVDAHVESGEVFAE